MKVMAVILAMALVLSGCSMAFTPNKKFLFHPKPLVEAEQTVEQARLAGKDKQCPAEFKSAQNLADEAYQIYWDCKDAEAIRMAEGAMAKAKALCPAPAPTAEIKPEVKPETPTPLPPTPPSLPPAEPKKPEVKIELPPAPKPKPTIVLEDVHFEFDKSSLTEETKKILEKNIQILKDNPEIKVRVEGHACSHGTEKYNLALSERRATTVMIYLVHGGIDEGRLSRLSAIGYGETKPVIPEDPTPYNKESEAMRANRRVHFEIVK